jgi:SAM-dependent methyltransferase
MSKHTSNVNQELLAHYFYTVEKLNLHPSGKRLKFNLESIFEDIDFKNKRVLDIGGGFGLISFYAAVKGAKTVVCIEPEADGSTTGANVKFDLLLNDLGVHNVSILPRTFQEYENDKSFDIIILNNSINHLNEDKCIVLRNSKEAQTEYKSYFDKMYQLSNIDAHIVICDCSNSNFFNDIGVRNPFMPTIEWEKHQSPSFWTELMSQSGFKLDSINWTTFNRTGKVGKFVMGNKYLSYFLQSHFCIKLQK